MRALLLFLVCFTTSTGLVIALCGGIRPPRAGESAGPRAAHVDGRGVSLTPILDPGARGIYVGAARDAELRVVREEITGDRVRHIRDADFRFESIEPLSTEALRAQGITADLFDEEGTPAARVSSHEGVLRLDPKTWTVASVELRGSVRLHELRGENPASLETSELDLDFPPTDSGRAEHPVFSTDERVTIRQEGLELSGTGFGPPRESGDTTGDTWHGFRLERDVELRVTGEDRLTLPDLSVGGDSPATGALRIVSPGPLEVQATPTSSPDGPASRSGFGLERARVRFLEATRILKQEQRIDTGGLRLDLVQGAGEDAGLEATRLDARSVVIHDGDLELRADGLAWDRDAGPETYVLTGHPEVRMRRSEADEGLLPGTGREGARSILVSCRDRLVLRPATIGPGRTLEAHGDVFLAETVLDGETSDEGLRAGEVHLHFTGTGDDAQFSHLRALRDVELRDPAFAIRGGRFDLERLAGAEVEITVQEDPVLDLAPASLSGLEVELVPGSGRTGDATAGDGAAVSATAGERIVMTRKSDATTFVDFLGGFRLEKRVGETLESSLESDRMLLSLRQDESGSQQIRSWSATGHVDYRSASGETARGDRLAYARERSELTLTGGSGARRAFLVLPGDTPEEEQVVRAERLRYLPDDNGLSAYGDVESELFGDAVTWEGIEAAGLSRSAASEGSDEGTDEPGGEERSAGTGDPRQRWTLRCREADLAFRAPEDETERHELTYVDARSDVRIRSESQQIDAEQITYDATRSRVLVLGSVEEPARARLRHPEFPDEWDTLESVSMDIDTAEEVVRCPEGGVLRFRFEDLLRRDDEGAQRYPTRVSCDDELRFARDREIRFHSNVLAEQRAPGESEPFASLACELLRVVLDDGTGGEPGGPLRRVVCRERIRIRHPDLEARGDELKIDPRRTTIELYGEPGRAARLWSRRAGDEVRLQYLEHNYETGVTTGGQFEGGRRSRRGRSDNP